MPGTSSQAAGLSLEQILWRAMDRFREERALLDAEEFADRIAHAFDADLCGERFSERFFAGANRLHRKNRTLAGAIASSASRRLHVYEFDLGHVEYVIVEDKDRLIVVSSFGQFQLQNDDSLSRAVEAAVVKAPDRRGTEPRGYFVRARGEVVGLDVKKIARTLERARVRQVSMPAVDAPAARLAAFNPVRKTLGRTREEVALRQDPRLAQPLPRPSASGPARASAVQREHALFVLMPGGALARAEIGSATRWEHMLGQYARPAAREIAIDTGNVLALVRGTPQVAPGTRAETQGEAVAAVRESVAPVRALAGDDLARALTSGNRVVPAVAEGERFWIQPERAFHPELPLPGKTAVAEPVQLGEMTGDPWADWALIVGGAQTSRAGVRAEPEPADATMPAERARAVRPAPVQIAGSPVVAFRALDGSIIVDKDAGPIHLASVGRPESAKVPALAAAVRDRREVVVAVRERSELVPRTGAMPFSTLQTLEFALERSAAAGGYRLPALGIEWRPDAIGLGGALQATPLDSRRRGVRLAAPVTHAERAAHLVVSIPFPNRGELHAGRDLSEALQAWIAGAVLPANHDALALILPRTATTSAAFDLPSVSSPASRVPTIPDLPLLLRHAVAETGDWVPGPGAPLPLAVRDFAFRAPFIASEESTSPTPVAIPPPGRSPGEEEIVIPLPLWAQMGRRAIPETVRMMASPSTLRGHAAPLGTYRLVVPDGGPLDLTGGTRSGALGAVDISGPTGIRLETVASGGVKATSAGGRHFLGRVPVDEEAPVAVGRRRFRIGAPLSQPPPIPPPRGAVAPTSDPPTSISSSALVRGLEPGMWSGHRPSTTDRYRHWTYACWRPDVPQDGGVSAFSRRQHPQLPVVLRFRYPGALLWWTRATTTAASADDGSIPAARAAQAGLRAANSAAAIWRSILVASAPADDLTAGMDGGREASAAKMTSLARSFDAVSASLPAPTSRAATGTTAPAYIAMSSAGAAGTVSRATAAVARSRAQAVEMSIVAAIPPSPPPLESMSSATRAIEAPRARGKGHSHDAAHGHPTDADDAVSHSKIEGSVDAIAQRIYHRIRRRIESDRERFGG